MGCRTGPPGSAAATADARTAGSATAVSCLSRFTIPSWVQCAAAVGARPLPAGVAPDPEGLSFIGNPGRIGSTDAPRKTRRPGGWWQAFASQPIQRTWASPSARHVLPSQGDLLVASRGMVCYDSNRKTGQAAQSGTNGFAGHEPTDDISAGLRQARGRRLRNI